MLIEVATGSATQLYSISLAVCVRHTCISVFHYTHLCASLNLLRLAFVANILYLVIFCLSTSSEHLTLT